MSSSFSRTVLDMSVLLFCRRLFALAVVLLFFNMCSFDSHGCPTDCVLPRVITPTVLLLFFWEGRGFDGYF